MSVDWMNHRRKFPFNFKKHDAFNRSSTRDNKILITRGKSFPKTDYYWKMNNNLLFMLTIQIIR